MIAFDLETVWSPSYSVAKMGLDRYVKDPRFKVTLVSLWSPTFQWVGKPSDLPVERLAGQDLCAHNAEFDSVCARMAIARGQMPAFSPASWTCTADMSVWHQYPRSLSASFYEMFGAELSKEARDQMAGLDPEAIASNPAFREYALLDSKACWELWNEFKDTWPEKEALLSQLTRRIASRGLPLDGPLCQKQIDALDDAMIEAGKILPWNGAAPITSPNALKDACRLAGVDSPPSSNEDDPKLLRWKNKHPTQAAWVEAMTRYRKANKAEKQFRGLILRTRPDARVSTRLKYCGAPHTGRWSGAGGINFQAIPRAEVAGTSMKKCLAAPAGKVLVTADLSQIEPRILHWLAGDLEFLSLVGGGIDLYEAHGRASGLYKEDEPMKDFAPEMRHLCKARTLGLGYGCGAKRFVQVAHALTGGALNLSFAAARNAVIEYRRQNPLVLKLWDQLEEALRFFIQRDEDVGEILTPNGKPIKYFDLSEKDGDLVAAVTKGEKTKRLFGGLLVENLVQATAREIFADALLRLEAMGLPVCLHVHDSVTVEVAESEGDAALSALVQVLSEPPAWAKGLPLAAEGEIKGHY